MYNKTVMSRFSKPRFAGNVKKPEAVAEVTNLDCGDVVKISARIDEKEVIREAKFKAFGSVATIASCDVACSLMIGKTLDEALEISNKDIFEILGELPSHKIYSTNLAESAIKDVVADFYDRKKKEAKKLAKKQAMLEAEQDGE